MVDQRCRLGQLVTCTFSGCEPVIDTETPNTEVDWRLRCWVTNLNFTQCMYTPLTLTSHTSPFNKNVIFASISFISNMQLSNHEIYLSILSWRWSYTVFDPTFVVYSTEWTFYFGFNGLKLYSKAGNLKKCCWDRMRSPKSFYSFEYFCNLQNLRFVSMQ